jgi:hypothetical protein
VVGKSELPKSGGNLARRCWMNLSASFFPSSSRGHARFANQPRWISHAFHALSDVNMHRIYTGKLSYPHYQNYSLLHHTTLCACRCACNEANSIQSPPNNEPTNKYIFRSSYYQYQYQRSLITFFLALPSSSRCRSPFIFDSAHGQQLIPPKRRRRHPPPPARDRRRR